MNKFMIVIRVVIIITFAFFFGNPEGYAHASKLSESSYRAPAEYVSDQLIKSRLENLSSVIEIHYTPEVGRRIREYTVNYRVAGEKILGRVDRFFPLFEDEIYKRNLPHELKFIAIVESNLDPHAYSKAGAVGLWQFIKSTGRMKGLKIDNYIDERRDPEKSTKAAMDYLTDLYNEFDDWTLAIAAYNCGPGNVRKAMRRSGSKDFWEMRYFLPNETQKYVPRIIAAMYLMKYYHAHDLVPRDVDADLKHVVTIQDGKGHSFARLADELNVSYKTLRKLNPQFKTSHFPKNKQRLKLIIPASRFDTYLEIHDNDRYRSILQEREKKAKEKERLEMKIKIMSQKIVPLQHIEKKYYQEVLVTEWKREIEPNFLYSET